MKQETAIEYAIRGYNIFLTGKAGTGKTYTLKKIIRELKGLGKMVAVTASTGIAGVHLGGSTIHSWAGIGIKTKLTQDDLFKIANSRFSRERIFHADTLVIDEISMLHDFRFDMVEEVCRFVKNMSIIFGGMQVIVSGDFFQLPPVNRDGKKNYCFNSQAWKNINMKTCYLQKIYRQQNDEEFIGILNNIRSNSITADQKNKLDELSNNKKYYDLGVNLYCKNVSVDIENATQLSKIKSESFFSKMTSEGLEFKINDLKKNCLAPENLTIKKGAKVMILVNDIPKMRYCNGTLGEVVDLDAFDEGVITIKSYKTGEYLEIGKFKWELEEYSPKEKRDIVVASVTQFPIKLAWALTVHKSQGATFDYVNLDLRDAFEENMGYVALSRVTSMDGLFLAGYKDESLYVDDYVLEHDKIFQEESLKNESIDDHGFCEGDIPF